MGSRMNLEDEPGAPPVLKMIMGQLRKDGRTKHLHNDPEYRKMLRELGEDPMIMEKYLEDDRLRLTLSALLRFDLEKLEDMNFDEPPFVDDDFSDVGFKTGEQNREKKVDKQLSNEEKAKKEKDLGTQFLKKNEFSKAHEHYDAAIRHDPCFIEAYSNKALAYQRQKLPEKVREVSQQVIDIGRKHGGNKKIIAKAYMRIGQAYFDEGKFAPALENFKLCMKDNEDSMMLSEAERKVEECRNKSVAGKNEN